MSPCPAFIASYDDQRRTVRVSIPGLTDGAALLPEAQICYSIGDDYNFTEIQINEGIPVWVDFIGGDPRYPLVTGWRAPQSGNANGWRKWQHANIAAIAAQVLELVAGSEMTLTVGGTVVTLVDGKATIQATDTEITGNVVVDGTLTSKGAFTFESGMEGSGGEGGGAAMTINGNTAFEGSVTANGKNIDDSHRHTSEAPGTPTSDVI